MSERLYRQVPADAAPEEFRAWFSQLYEALTGRPAQGSATEWQQRYDRLRDAFEAVRTLAEHGH
jgi:hypothetical protein